MDSGQLTIMKSTTGRYGVRRPPWFPHRRKSAVFYLCNQGAAEGYLPAAALDLAIHLIQTKDCDQGKAPSPRRVENPTPRFPANAAGLPHYRGSVWPCRFASALQNSPKSIKSLTIIKSC